MKPGLSRGQIAATLLACAALHGADQKPKPNTAQPLQATGDLVWPLPPDPPRVRWLAEYTDLARVKKPEAKKQGWMDKLAGTKTLVESLELRKPYGIAADRDGRIYTADTELKAVFVIDAANRTVARREGSSRVPLGMPVGVALDSDNRLFVSDAELHSVICFSPAGQPQALFGTAQLGRPGGIAIDRARNRLYVADAKEGRIAVFDTKTLALNGYLGKPSVKGKPENGTFFGPTNVTVDRNGLVYVADTLNYRIQILDANGKFVRAFGMQGDRPGEFIRPKGVAVDSEGHIYVADAEFNNFQIFTPEGTPLMALGNLGSGPGQFTLIAGLFIDERDRIYTTEMFRGRVQVFQYLLPPGTTQGKGVGGGSSH